MRIEFQRLLPDLRIETTFVAELDEEFAPRWFRGGSDAGSAGACHAKGLSRIALAISHQTGGRRRSMMFAGWRGRSPRLRDGSKNFVATQYSTPVEFGTLHRSGWRSDNLGTRDCPEFRVWHNGKKGDFSWPDAKNRKSRTPFSTSCWRGQEIFSGAQPQHGLDIGFLERFDLSLILFAEIFELSFGA